MLPVPFAHALCVRRLDVLLHYLLPASATQPAPEEALHFLDLPQFKCLLADGSTGGPGASCTGLSIQTAGETRTGAVRGRWPPLLLQGT
jgi:hypothetical protein